MFSCESIPCSGPEGARRRCGARRLIAAALVVPCLVALSSARGQFSAFNAPVVGSIDMLKIDDPGDPWSGGIIVVGGQIVIIPRNMIIELPANFLSLHTLFADAPPECVARGESGLALADDCLNPGAGPVATILANRTAAGDIIAGDIFIEKGQESMSGQVTYINHTDGYFRINGRPGVDGGGTMVRVNDPDHRHTIQQGKGCSGGPNCSADVRFTNDPDNYTVAFSTGYPACIPSTELGVFGNRTAGGVSDAAGNGDAFCPDNNRGGNTVNDSRFFAPIQVGDSVGVAGNFEVVNGVRFLSAFDVVIGRGLVTANDPSQPDYMIYDEVEWDVAGFQNERVRTLFIGFTTDPFSQVTMYSLHVDPLTNENHEVPLASTIGNPLTINQGIGGNAGGIFKIRYDVDFITGSPVRDDLSPCQNLGRAGIAACSPQRTMAEEFSILSPITREMIGRTQRKQLNPGLQAFDVNGNDAPWGEYLTPVGVGHAEFVEINLDALNTPFIFTGEPWNLDRRLSPAGCIDTNGDGVVDCEATPQPLSPFPFSGLDPRTQALVPFLAQDRILSHFGTAGPATSTFELNFGTLAAALDPPAIGAGLGVTVTRATQKKDATATHIDVWATAEPGSTLMVDAAGIPPNAMTGDGTGRYFAHIDIANSVTPPPSVTVTNMADNSSEMRLLTDEVFVPEATFDVDTGTLAVSASSSGDSVSASLVTDHGVPITGGVLQVTGVSVPPQSITVQSSLGGAFDMPVTVVGTVGLPIAAAGADQVVSPGDIVTLDGTGSAGLINTYAWTQTGGASVALDPAPSDPANPALRTFAFPAGDNLLTFALTVTSPVGSTTDTVVVTNAVIANAGPNQIFAAHPGGTPIQLDAGASAGVGLAYSWVQTAGPAATLSDPQIANPTFVFPTTAAASLTFAVTASGVGGTSTSAVTVQSLLPAAPVADAGADLSVGVNGLVQLDGSGSSGDIGSYEWVQIGTGEVVALSDSLAINPSFIFPTTTQILTFQLTVTGPGGSDVATVTVTALDAPTAVAGTALNVLVNELVTLQGADSIGNISTYDWIQLSGAPVALGILGPGGFFQPFDGDLTNPTRVFFFGSTPDVLTFQLTVTGPGGSSTDTVTVTAESPFDPDVLIVSRAEYKENKGKWRIEGTSSVPGPGHTVSAYLGNPSTGTLIGTAAVDALGSWRVQTGNDSPADPTQGGPQTVSVVSTLGGVFPSAAFQIK